MNDHLIERPNLRVLSCDPDGPVLRDERGAMDLVAEAMGRQADLVVLPVSRLAPEFFTLSTGLAGAVLQKFVTYRLGLVVVGDIAERLAASAALRALVAECNRGRQVRFVDAFSDLDDLHPLPSPSTS